MTVALVASLLVVGAPPAALPWSKAAKVLAHTMNMEGNGRPECDRAVEDGVLCKSVDAGKAMTPDQVSALKRVVDGGQTWSQELTKCFIPHHAFVAYDTAGKPIGQVTICFMCEMAQFGTGPTKRSWTGRMRGITHGGMDALRGLCRDLGLPKCDADQP